MKTTIEKTPNFGKLILSQGENTIIINRAFKNEFIEKLIEICNDENNVSYFELSTGE